MHIQFITDNFPPETNAPASRTYEHAREWVKMGHRVQVLTCAPNFPYGKVFSGYTNKLVQKEDMDGIEVYRFWSYMAPNKGFVKRTLDFTSFMLTSGIGGIFLPRPDVILATSPQFFAALGGFLLSKVKRRPFVFEVRDLWPEQILEVQAMRDGLLVNGLFGLARFLYKNSDQIVTVGEGYKEKIVAGHPVDDKKIEIIPNGVFFELFSLNGNREAMRRELGWEEDFVVLYLGTHGMSQRLETVLEAAYRLNDQPGIRFAFVGEGAEKEKIVNLSKEWGLVNCQFLPMQPKDKVPAFYQAADACVVPLRDCELFQGNYPSKIFEAMAMQCPILLSLDGVSASLIRSVGSGLCLPPENPEELAQAVVYLKEHPEEARQMGEAGREYVLNHNSRRMWAEKYIQTIERVFSCK